MHKVFFTDPMLTISCIRLGQSFFKGVLTFFNTLCDMWYGKNSVRMEKFSIKHDIDSLSFTRNVYVCVSNSAQL